MIKEVLVVEGKMDVVAINKAVEADCIITGGFSLKKSTLKNINSAYESRGIIILTDPDWAGEQIRKRLTHKFPLAKHAFIPREEAFAHNDIGVEQALPASIQRALAKVHTHSFTVKKIFTAASLLLNGLSGSPEAAAKRSKVGSILGIGYANAKVFLRRLNTYGITKEDFAQAVKTVNKKMEVKK